MLKYLPAIAIVGLAAVTNYFLSSSYYFFDTKQGTVNVWCFEGGIGKLQIPADPDEWKESFSSKEECENMRAKRFNPDLPRKFQDRVKG